MPQRNDFHARQSGHMHLSESLDEYEMGNLIRIFQALSDLTRAKVVYALTRGECSVNDLAVSVGASPSAVSHHLRRLRDAGLVTYHRHRNQVLYSIEDAHIAAILDEARHHIDHAQSGSGRRARERA